MLSESLISSDILETTCDNSWFIQMYSDWKLIGIWKLIGWIQTFNKIDKRNTATYKNLVRARLHLCALLLSISAVDSNFDVIFVCVNDGFCFF